MTESDIQTEFPDRGFIILKHPRSATCPSSGVLMKLPYQNGGGHHSLSDLTRSAAERLNQSTTVSCNGCGATFNPVEVRAADAAAVIEMIADSLSRRRIPNR